MGNIYESPLKEIAENAVADEYRRRVRTTGIEACDSCTMKTYDNNQKCKQFKNHFGYVPTKNDWHI